jgi:alpha-L-fucosidase
MPNLLEIPTPLPRIANFERMGYGLFLHWGLYSQIGQGEWIQHIREWDWSEYEAYFNTFTAEDFDARAWARLAKGAGMRYACLTTRHHEGFSLYDTRGLSTFDAPHSPAGRDLVAEFTEACRAEGIVPFFYHTTLDWREKSHTCSEQEFTQYLDYLIASVEVLCTHYGKIGGFWFDGNWSRKGSDWREGELYNMIRKHQPEAIITNNSGLGAKGALGHPELDTTTFEQGRPTAPDRRGWAKYLTGEMCQTMNRHWGVGFNDYHYKGVPDIIETLCACRKVGANYLLNIGPTAQGGIPELEAATLQRAGQWVRDIAGELLCQGKPFAATCVLQDFILEREDKLYYFAHELRRKGSHHVVAEGGGQGPRAIGGITRPIKSVRWLDNDESLDFAHNPEAGLTALHVTPYPYGTELVVRIAEIS